MFCVCVCVLLSLIHDLRMCVFVLLSLTHVLRIDPTKCIEHKNMSVRPISLVLL